MRHLITKRTQSSRMSKNDKCKNCRESQHTSICNNEQQEQDVNESDGSGVVVGISHEMEMVNRLWWKALDYTSEMGGALRCKQHKPF